jgi:hypothetical protein
MDPVVLDQAVSDFGHRLVPEKGVQVGVDLAAKRVDVFRAALAVGQHLELIEKLLGGFAEGLALRQTAAPTVFAFEGQIPVLGEVLRLGQAVCLRARAKLVAADRC